MRRRELVLLLSGTMIASRALRAQQKEMPVVGFLGAGSAPSSPDPFFDAFQQGLSETGYVEGKTSRWNTGRRRATMIGCLHWPLTSCAAKST
jgi:hypothetical protein